AAGEHPRDGRELTACVAAHDRGAEHAAEIQRRVGHGIDVVADARDAPEIRGEHRGRLADLLARLDQVGGAVVEPLLPQQQLDDGTRHEAHEHHGDDELDQGEPGPAGRRVHGQHGRKLRNVSVRWRRLLKKVTLTVTSSARARRSIVQASEMPRLTAEPEPAARVTHGVARTRSKRDSATLAAIVRDCVLVSVDMMTDAVPAIAKRPTLKLMTATSSSTMV